MAGPASSAPAILSVEASLDVSIILPTYNERDNIVPLIAAIQEVLDGARISHEVIVVDDESPDGTAQAVRERF
ncbi:MAG: glycosyltransferase, partial [Chloroflexota bacterium]